MPSNFGPSIKTVRFPFDLTGKVLIGLQANMRQLRPVMWAKGTFLTPQHLQTQDRFIESTFQFRLEALNFRPWGFADLHIRHEALAEGNFAVSKAVGIFPDGLPFEIPDSDPAPPPKPLAPFFDAEQQSVDVYLAIPSERE